MAKKNVKVTMDEATIIGIKRLAKERGTSVSAMMQARIVEDIRNYEAEFGPLDMSKAIRK